MAMHFRYFVLFIILCFRGFSFGQDIHFSHVNRQPLYQNPANTGLFKGDIRLTANYKDQWRSVTVPFTTIAIAGDVKWKPKGMAFGAFLFYDKVGDGKFKTIEFITSAAKIFKLTSDSTHSISAGLQFGMNYRQVDYNQFYYGEQFDGLVFNPNFGDKETFNNDRKFNLNVGVGASYQWRMGNKQQLTVGISGHNLNRPNQGFFGTKIHRDPRMSLFASYERPLNQELSLLPGLSFNLQGTYRELVLGTQVRYTLIEKLGTYRAVDAGIWFRSKDAVIIRVGLAMQNWSVALSYDTNISKLIPASSLRGGLELSAHYIITRFKPKKITHRVCPDYI